MNEKETGSFYTPQKLIEYMVSYVKSRLHPNSILEPSAGDGRFINALSDFQSTITAVELDEGKVRELNEKYGTVCGNICCDDFINYSLESENTFDLVIGNPPYIAKKVLDETQCEKSEKIVNYYKLDKSVFQNLWVSFVLSSIKLLSKEGAIFFVLPFEFLQVQYAEKLRGFLETRFNTIEIITFEERIFEDIEQDICLVYLANEVQNKPYIKYTTLISAEDTTQTFQSVIMRNKPLKKWSNCILNDEETDKLMAMSSRYTRVSEFGDSSPGIVTGANKYFILSKKESEALNVPETHVLPIITRSSSIPASLIFKQEDFEKICSEEVRTHLLNLTGLKHESFSPNLKKYIEQGENDKIHEGYKCRNRKRWYDVPVVKNGDICFFKRFHNIPKVVVNEGKIHTTDMVYNIRLHPEYKPNSFAFCFYNSLTLALCEYNGRFYGGGVGEMVPSEFKQVSIPYKDIKFSQVNKLDKMFRENADIQKIIDYVDGIVLSDLPDEDIRLLQNIRKKYISRRMKNI